jgi:hypothetical protein
MAVRQEKLMILADDIDPGMLSTPRCFALQGPAKQANTNGWQIKAF